MTALHRLSPHSFSLPTTLSRSYRLFGIETDAYVQIFHDRLVVGISQRQQKIGTWCYLTAAQSAVDPRAIDWDISNVLGDRNDAMVGVYVRQLTEQIIAHKLFVRANNNSFGSHSMAILFGATLKDGGKDPEMFRVVLEVLLQLIRDALAQQQQE
jgi:hypothetical protein